MYHHVPTMLTSGFTEAHVMTYMLPNQSTCIGIFLLRILNLFNLPITRSI